MKEHVTGQDGDAAALFNRGVRIAKRSSEPMTNEAIEFVPVRVDEATTAGASSRCRFRHAGGHELEFTELPEVTWLAALVSRNIRVSVILGTVRREIERQIVAAA